MEKIEKLKKKVQSVEIYTGENPLNAINVSYKGFIVANKVKISSRGVTRFFGL